MWMLYRSYFPYLEFARTETHTAFYYPTHSPSPVLFMWMCVWVSHWCACNCLINGLICSLFVHTLAWSEVSFFLLHYLSGTVSLAKLNHQTHSHLSGHLWSLTSSSYILLTVCVYVCVHTQGSLFWLCCSSLLCNGLCAPVWRNCTQKSTWLLLLLLLLPACFAGGKHVCGRGKANRAGQVSLLMLPGHVSK